MRVLLAPSQTPTNYPKYWEKLEYPLLGSPKLDGIRGMVGEGELVMSRTWKPIPSYQVQDLFGALPEWVDGELIEGRVTDGDVYNRTQSYVMSADKEGDLSYHLFDYARPDLLDAPYVQRLDELRELILPENVFIVPQTPLNNYEELIEYEATQLNLGFEGVMLRTPYGRYKQNRATINEGIIYKLKRFEDAEGVVVDYVERQKNNNELERDERGYAKRSSSKAGKQAVGTLGKFKVEFQGRVINVGPGHFTHAELQAIWDSRDDYLGLLLKFRYFAHGIKDEPRHARAIGWRDPIDV